MPIHGAGGSKGGIGRFFMGLIMMTAGGYLFLDAIRVTHGFHMGFAIYSFGSVRLTAGMVLIPLIFGIGMIFYNARNPLGWFLGIGSLTMLLFGIVSSVNFTIRSMSAFELITILVLLIGGIGLFLSSLKSYDE
ncbi:MAG: hypothetical protein R2941_04630 [Desulfobacterales bacterium]